MTADPTTPPAAPATRAPRWMRLLLAASLALNLLVAGIVAGGLLHRDGPGGRMRPADLALGPVARALDEGDRRAILGALREGGGLRPLDRDPREAGLRAIAEAVRAEPFDAARLRGALDAQAGRIEAAQRAVREALVERVAAMGPEGRAAFADRLLADRGGHR